MDHTEVPSLYYHRVNWPNYCYVFFSWWYHRVIRCVQFLNQTRNIWATGLSEKIEVMIPQCANNFWILSITSSMDMSYLLRIVLIYRLLPCLIILVSGFASLYPYFLQELSSFWIFLCVSFHHVCHQLLALEGALILQQLKIGSYMQSQYNTTVVSKAQYRFWLLFQLTQFDIYHEVDQMLHVKCYNSTGITDLIGWLSNN